MFRIILYGVEKFEVFRLKCSQFHFLTKNIERYVMTAR